MDARRLVGMTEGAKKRAARRWVASKGDADPGARAWWRDEARQRYRIGERLTPCRGCEACRGECWHGRRSCCPRHCDGSGVLPAKQR